MDDNLWIPPFSLLWTSIPCVVPPVGHMAISDSRGVIHDFGGFINISQTRTIFGVPKRFYSFENELSVKQKEEWDQHIMNAEQKYKNVDYNLFTANCHHFASDVLNRTGVSGKKIGVTSLAFSYRFRMRSLKREN